MVVTSSIRAVLPYKLQKIWEVVTSLSDCSWRSELERIEVISGTQFVEITTGGHKTVFTITKQEPYHLWEFDIENEMMEGHWIGVFCGNEENTIINFTEYIRPKKWFPYLFVKVYLKIQQIKYIRDLKRKLKTYDQ